MTGKTSRRLHVSKSYVQLFITTNKTTYIHYVFIFVYIYLSSTFFLVHHLKKQNKTYTYSKWHYTWSYTKPPWTCQEEAWRKMKKSYLPVFCWRGRWAFVEFFFLLFRRMWWLCPEANIKQRRRNKSVGCAHNLPVYRNPSSSLSKKRVPVKMPKKKKIPFIIFVSRSKIF